MEITRSLFHYDIDVRRMEQTNKEIRKTRKIFRSVVQIQYFTQATTQKQNQAQTLLKSSSATPATVVSCRGQASDIKAAIVKFRKAVEGTMATRTTPVPELIVSDMPEVLKVVADHYKIEPGF